MKGRLKKTITAVAIGSLMFSYFLVPAETAFAQFSNANTLNTGYNPANIGSYIQGLTPAITQLPGCMKKNTSGIANLFGGGTAGGGTSIGGAGTGFDSISDLGVDHEFGNTPNLESITNEASQASLSVPSYDANANAQLKLLLGKTNKIEKSTTSIDTQKSCTDAIGKMMVKFLLQKVTLGIVNWINTGYNGAPFFIQNPGQFFSDVAKHQILGFNNAISDLKQYPFGQNFIAGTVNYNKEFAQTAKFSLDQIIGSSNPGMTANNFYSDFNNGGWNAWVGMTQYPQNNPVGFSIIAGNALSKKISTETTNIQNNLLQSGGFLSDQKCVDPGPSITLAMHNQALADNDPSKQCKRFEYVTPGKLIAEKATTAVNYSDNQMLKAQDLNDAIAIIIDAALGKLVSDLTSNGFSSINPSQQFATSSLSDFNPAPTGTQFQDIYTSDGSWLSSHPNFNLKTDLTQAVVDEQRTYLSKLSSYNDALTDLIKNIRQLDYCIPGPNPDWQSTSLDIMQNIGGVKNSPKWWESAAAQGIGSTLDPTGIFGIVTSIISSNDSKTAAANYVAKILKVPIDSGQDQMTDQSSINNLFNNVFDSYRKVINSVYFSPGHDIASGGYMPTATFEARAEFQKIAGYQQIIEDNIGEIALKKSIIARLTALKQKIDALDPTSATYEDNFQLNSAITNEFARLSIYLVDGDDIANIDTLYKQAIDRQDYVNDDLLTGAFGCETELTKLWFDNLNNPNSPFLKYANRRQYPYPIDHLYGSVFTGNGSPYQFPYSSNYYVVSEHEGFLYGAIYRNNQIGSPSPDASCVNKFISHIDFSLPNSQGDIGMSNSNSGYFNNCGVVTRGFEKMFGVY